MQHRLMMVRWVGGPMFGILLHLKCESCRIARVCALGFRNERALCCMSLAVVVPDCHVPLLLRMWWQTWTIYTGTGAIC